MIEPRKEVAVFAEAMEKTLKKNDGRKPRKWTSMNNSFLLHRLKEEVVELKRALINGDIDNIMHESTDVANFAMMLFDNNNNKRSKQ